ncbi:MAG: hypothetical protein LQ349_001209 [Xanthoria aureola]|nr:MAG: hypothetical protein LQ349_001209 [Xanthoria aureola]
MLAVLLYVPTISAAVLTPPEVLSPEESLANQGQPPPYDGTVRLNLTDVFSNTSTMAHNMSSGSNLLRADCNGRRYGVHVNSRSCFNALRLIPRTNEQLKFGMRYTPTGLASTIKLPYRWLSRGDNELGVVMQKNFPGDVHCLARPAPRPFTCRNIVDTIFATSRRELFGPGGHPQVEAALPTVFSDAGEECFATIKDPTRGSSYASWYNMWEAITTIYWRCMAGSVPLTGKAFGIGSARSIEMILSDRPER